MKKRVLCLLTNGFEEIEAITPIDLLRRAGIEVRIASLANAHIEGRNGIVVKSEGTLDDVDTQAFDLLFIPGGPGVNHLRSDGRAAKLAREFHDAGKLIAAICAAPLVLKDAGLLVGKNFTAHFSVHDDLPGVSGDKVVEDGNLITSRGAGTAMDFGLALVARLAGLEAAEKVARDVMA